jgi:hypothetical protein
MLVTLNNDFFYNRFVHFYLWISTVSHREDIIHWIHNYLLFSFVAFIQYSYLLAAIFNYSFNSTSITHNPTVFLLYSINFYMIFIWNIWKHFMRFVWYIFTLIFKENETKLQWLQDPRQISADNLSSVILINTNKYFRKKYREIWKVKLIYLKQTVRTRMSETCIEASMTSRRVNSLELM